MTALKHVASIPLAAVVLGYRALDALLGPFIRPAIAYVGSLRLFQRLGEAIAGLPPYALLALLVVPFVVIEPLKVASLYWMAIGHPFKGVAALVICYALSLLTSERILHIGRPKLLTIRWFAVPYRFVVDLGERAKQWLRTTTVWRAGLAAAETARAFVNRFRSA